MFTASVVKVVYGFDVGKDPDGQWYLSLMEKANEGALAFTPGKYLVQFLPFLRHIPEWMPGAGFQTQFREWREASHESKVALLRRTRSGLVSVILPYTECTLTQGGACWL